ncbi:Ig-like domain-containing protein [Parageobacillus thermantarcticus]|uniref:Ig-like domain-containing protein n=1 Tax=Parageobacillus thermantarcticus TaxID=186116 RepID=A0A1I0TP13_9BACL|nr:Ig-like domain-containing protein [Parageobacillus thermantarcticus]SFA53303.1 Ig-like domain-containing protein [Parageobacillus thermantarcticus]
MYKKLSMMVAAIFAAGSILSAPAFAEPKGHNEPSKNHEEKKQDENKNGEKEKEKEKQKEQKGYTQQLKSIDKQLDKIEEKLRFYKNKLADLKEEDSEEPVTEPTTEEEPSLTAPTGDDTVDNGTSPSGEQGETPAAGETAEAPATNEAVANTAFQNEANETGGETTSEESGTKTELADDSTETSEGVEEGPTDEEIEQEVEEIEEDVQENPSYIGKLHALENRLNAVKNRLDALSSKISDQALLQERYDRIEALRTEIQQLLSSMDNIGKKIKEQIEKDEEAEEKETVTGVPATKEWAVKFNKSLDEQTLSEIDFVVLDADGNVVETTIQYEDAERTVKVIPLQPYKSGQTYTLYIGKEIKDMKGLSLKKAVKMKFVVK